jgi:hypothetical protein
MCVVPKYGKARIVCRSSEIPINKSDMTYRMKNTGRTHIISLEILNRFFKRQGPYVFFAVYVYA